MCGYVFSHTCVFNAPPWWTLPLRNTSSTPIHKVVVRRSRCNVIQTQAGAAEIAQQSKAKGTFFYQSISLPTGGA